MKTITLTERLRKTPIVLNVERIILVQVVQYEEPCTEVVIDISQSQAYRFPVVESTVEVAAIIFEASKEKTDELASRD